MRLNRAVVAALVTVLLPGVGLTQDDPVRAADVPKEFRGQYQWRGVQEFYKVVVKLERLEEVDGVIRFSGTSVYWDGGVKKDVGVLQPDQVGLEPGPAAPGYYRMKVTGTINVKTRVVTFRESDPSRDDASTDGQFRGILSADSQTIEAIWTSKESGSKGDLRVGAKSSR